MIEVFKIPVSKAQLQAMPSNERALFILLGHAANQLNLFTKLVIFSSNKTTDDDLGRMLSAAQTQMLMRMAIGILHESWAKIIKPRFLGSPLGKQYRPLLDKGGQDALDALNKLFGGSNLLTKIRNSYAFHHPYDADIEAACDLATASSEFDDKWNWYFSRSNFNAFYFVSEVVILHGILKEIGEGNLVAAQQRLMGEVNTALTEMTQLIMALTAAIWRKNFGDEIQAHVPVEVIGAPSLYEFWLPFFVEVPDELP
jgi:hypothetical protein